jgi:hypothetical protein
LAALLPDRTSLIATVRPRSAGPPPQDLLSEYYSLQDAWQQDGCSDNLDEWLVGEDVQPLQQQQSAQPAQGPMQANPTGGGTGASAAGPGPLSAEVSLLEAQLGAVLQQREEKGQAHGGGGGLVAGVEGMAAGLLGVHTQLMQLQQRVVQHLESLSSIQGLAREGLVADDGTVDRRAGLGAMVQLEDTLNGEP